ncbi:response regulator transcription factor [Pelagicoccus sp. SDUM812005]|uniref:response regulator transcription factor n=1 Tax=Pelagicoccus sp. SDUM812005 TaxID=3041257 RepID=UPI00280E1D5F|nr:response regulator transcription factor [Pelagicoccus sp. SDUM812005]MDQ8183844.1 response regulator transcription factor [Pelagicoccus sp. SDUM812005]
MKKTKLTLVEDNAGYREMLAEIVSSQDGMELISEFGTAEGALNSIMNANLSATPDLVLLDLNLPGMPGLEAMPYFKSYAPKVQIIVLTQSDREADIVEAIRKGAAGYLLKSSTAAEIRAAIRAVASGGASLDPKVAQHIMELIPASPQRGGSGIQLSERETEVLELLAKGLQKKEIADQLSISITTVADHVRRIYCKLEVPNAPSAIHRAHELGLFHGN